jgi:hypothetical protein
MFEFKHGASQNDALLQAWQALGFDLFRWSAELPCCCPSTRHRRAGLCAQPVCHSSRPSSRHWSSAACWSLLRQLATEPALEAGARGLLWLCQQPAMQGPGAGFRLLHDDAYGHALRAVAAAHGARRADASPACGADDGCAAVLFQAMRSRCRWRRGLGPAGAHVCWRLGAAGAAVQMAGGAAGRSGPPAAADEPFMPPLRSDLQAAQHCVAGSWLRQMLGEFVQTHCAYSSYFMPPVPQRFAALLQHPDHSAEIERRFLLMHVTAGTAAPVARLSRLAEPGQTHNPTLWQGLMQAMAVGNHPRSRQHEPDQQPEHRCPAVGRVRHAHRACWCCCRCWPPAGCASLARPLST